MRYGMDWEGWMDGGKLNDQVSEWSPGLGKNYTLFKLHARSNCIHPFLGGAKQLTKWVTDLNVQHQIHDARTAQATFTCHSRGSFGANENCS